MTGALLQLNVKGPQDLFLTGNPEHNFIKQVYKRHVNFAIQKKSIKFQNDVDFGRKTEIHIPRYGDLLHKLYFRFKLPSLTPTSGTYAGWTNSIGHALIEYVDLEIGGQIIDRHYGLFLEIWDELTQSPSINSNSYLLVGKFNHKESLQKSALLETEYEVPLQFYFSRNLGASLPLISLQYHPVKLIFKLRSFDECIIYDGVTPPEEVNMLDSSLLAEYIYLEDLERMKLKDKEHSFLIQQTQTVFKESVPFTNGGFHKALLPFNHPCLELIFVLTEQDSEDNNDWFNFAQRTVITADPVIPLLENAKLLIDGKERIETSSEFTLRIANNARYHTLAPSKHIYTIPFCNEPEKFYPTGSLNFSFIDQVELQIQLKKQINSPVNLYVFAKNFNILRIKDGMVQLGFSS